MKLHLGCGPKYLPGYIHIDIQKYPHIDKVLDISDLKDIEDDSIDEIYSCHVLEHFPRHKVVSVLREWRRVLKVGGILRIAVPDFEACNTLYNRTGKIASIYGLICGGQRNDYDYHYIVFDLSSLTEILEYVGFTHVQRYDAVSFLPSNYDDYSLSYIPHMDKSGLLMSLNVTASKHEVALSTSDVVEKLNKNVPVENASVPPHS